MCVHSRSSSYNAILPQSRGDVSEDSVTPQPASVISTTSPRVENELPLHKHPPLGAQERQPVGCGLVNWSSLNQQSCALCRVLSLQQRTWPRLYQGFHLHGHNTAGPVLRKESRGRHRSSWTEGLGAAQNDWAGFTDLATPDTAL